MDRRDKITHLPYFGIPKLIPYLKPYAVMIFVMIFFGLAGTATDIVLPLF